MPKFQAGKTVRLKSGGPSMTIVKIDKADGQEILSVIWITSKGEKLESEFPADLCYPDEGILPEMILL